MRLGLLLSCAALTACGYRPYVGPDSAYVPVCEVEASIADTAPGFELPKSQPAVLIAAPATDPTPFQQKLAAELRAVVVDQGGSLTEAPATADLVFAVDAAFHERSEQQIRNAPLSAKGVAVLGGTKGWSL